MVNLTREVQEENKRIEGTMDTYISNDKLLLWDFMKMKMRSFIISYSKEKAKVRRKEIETIEKEIKELENKLLNEPSKSLVE